MLRIKKGAYKMASRYLALDKLKRFVDIIRFNGGVMASVRQLYRTDDLKIGNLVGVDKYGNKYYENNMYFYGRNRWVDYNEIVNTDYDGSQVPAEWHRWLHYITDDPPTKVAPIQHRWMVDHVENMSGTSDAYVPYSTTKQKIESWVPPK